MKCYKWYYKWCEDFIFYGIDRKVLDVPEQMRKDWNQKFIEDAIRTAEALHEKILRPEHIIESYVDYRDIRFKLAEAKIIHNLLKIKKNPLAEIFKKEIYRYTKIKKRMLKSKKRILTL